MAERAPTEQRMAVPPPPDTLGVDTREEMPRIRFTRRRLLISILFVVSTVAFLYLVLPKILGLQETWNRIQEGNVWWLALGVVLEVCSFGGYIAVFRGVFVRGESQIGWRESYQITMAGLAATRLFAAGGRAGSRSPPGRCGDRGWRRGSSPAG